MSLAIVFPGQGSQAVGMLSQLGEKQSIVLSTFQQASDKLGFDLWDMVTNGPKEELDRTENTQPALLAGGVAIWRIWQQSGGAVPAVMAGHSLGEYTALVAANVMDFGDAVTLVRDRGRLMQQAVPAGTGAMAAILGMQDEQVMEVCAQNSKNEIVSIANFNSPGQVVIAGHTGAVKRVADSAGKAGAKRVVMLKVSVPSHCILMREAADNFAHRLAEVPFCDAEIPVIQNVDATQRTDAEAIRNALIQQIHQPVRWTDTILRMKSAGIRKLIECGPGKVLTSLTRRIDREIDAYAVFDNNSLAIALAAA